MTPRSTASAVVFPNRFRDGKRWINLAAAYEMTTTTRASLARRRMASRYVSVTSRRRSPTPLSCDETAARIAQPVG